MDNKREERRGVVEGMVIGPGKGERLDVRGEGVYEPVVGGPSRKVGFVKEGVAYEFVMGGPARRIGRVKYE